jgi:integration host factor subunit beta
MIRSDLIDILIQRNPGLHREAVEEAVKELLQLLSGTLATGNRIEIRGFGSFELRRHPPRTARNPKTGEPVQLGNHCRVRFKPGLELKEMVNRHGR